MKGHTDTDLAWMAGLIDGEGAIQIAKDYGTAVSVEMCEESGVRRCKEICDALKIHVEFYGLRKRRRRSRSNHRRGWLFKIARHSGVKAILEAVAPYLVVKKERAELMLEYVNRRIRIGHRTTHSVVHGRFLKTFTEEDRIFYEKMKKLNRRGEQNEPENERKTERCDERVTNRQGCLQFF
jgi:hypothetical protein